MARPCSAFIREDRPEGTHIKKSFVIVISLFVVGLILGGIAFDRQRAKERQRIAAQKTAAEQAKDKVPPLPQWGALLPGADEVEVSGSAMYVKVYRPMWLSRIRTS